MLCGAQGDRALRPPGALPSHSRFHRIRSHRISSLSSTSPFLLLAGLNILLQLQTSVMLLSEMHHPSPTLSQFKPRVHFYLYPLHISDTTCPTITLPPAKGADHSTSLAHCLCFITSAAGRTANSDVLPRIDVCTHIPRQKKTDVISYSDSAEMSRH